MSWVTQMLLFGLLALVLFALSALAIRRKRYAAGLGFGLLELLSAAISSSAWRWALRVSGKTDWRLLGLHGYPLIAFICYSMFAVGGLCAAVSIVGIYRNRKVGKPAPQD